MVSMQFCDGSFAISQQLQVGALSFDGDLLIIHASTETSAAQCPYCGQSSRRMHGCHVRTLADLP